MKKRNLTKLMSLFLASILVIPTPVFADNTTEITGSVQEAVLDISASLNATYNINPNDESGNYFTANNIEIINNSNMPISIAVKDIASDNTFTDVLPDSVGSKEDWYKLAYNDSNSKIAVGLKYVSGDFIEQNQTDTLYFKSILDATEAIPIGSIAAKNSLTYTLEGYHGLSFSEGKSHVTDITWEFSLYDGSEGGSSGGSSGNENTVTIDKEESTVLNYETETTDTASAASILDDLFGVHTVAALEVVKESEINGRPIVGTATITGLKDSSATEIEIADYYEVNGQLYKITGIKEGLEDSPTIEGASLETVTISGTNITEIPAYAFYKNDALTNVTIEEGITSIGRNAFAECTNLNTVSLPDGLTSIGDSCFYNDNSLESIEIPDSVNYLGGADGFTFYKTAITDITIPEGIDVIGMAMFSGCNNLTNITIPSTITTISQEAFEGCSNLSKINSSIEGQFNLPNITRIGDKAFNSCTKLEQITVSNELLIIGDSAFGACTNLSKINSDVEGQFILPDTMTYLGDSAFGNCDSVISVNIPKNIKSIANYLFTGCDKLETVTLNENVTTIGMYSFEKCKTLHTINLNEGLIDIQKNAFYICSNLTNIELPSTVTNIGNYAFFYCESISSLTIPSTVTSIGIYAFKDVQSITNNSSCTDDENWGALAAN